MFKPNVINKLIISYVIKLKIKCTNNVSPTTKINNLLKRFWGVELLLCNNPTTDVYGAQNWADKVDKVQPNYYLECKSTITYAVF